MGGVLDTLMLNLRSSYLHDLLDTNICKLLAKTKKCGFFYNKFKISTRSILAGSADGRLKQFP